MLKFYYHPISANARRVWVALIEKQIPFEPILVNLGGEQFSDQFTAINPLQRIPVIVDQEFRLMESLAILDYLELKYPQQSLMPTQAEEIAKMRMMEMIAVNELQPATIPLTQILVGLKVNAKKVDEARQRITTIMEFYEHSLGENYYLVNNEFTLADVVAGTLLPSLSHLGFPIDNYSRLKSWSQNLEQRKSWQQTSLTSEIIEVELPNIRAILEKRL